MPWGHPNVPFKDRSSRPCLPEEEVVVCSDQQPPLAQGTRHPIPVLSICVIYIYTHIDILVFIYIHNICITLICMCTYLYIHIYMYAFYAYMCVYSFVSSGINISHFAAQETEAQKIK